MGLRSLVLLSASLLSGYAQAQATFEVTVYNDGGQAPVVQTSQVAVVQTAAVAVAPAVQASGFNAGLSESIAALSRAANELSLHLKPKDKKTAGDLNRNLQSLKKALLQTPTPRLNKLESGPLRAIRVELPPLHQICEAAAKIEAVLGLKCQAYLVAEAGFQTQLNAYFEARRTEPSFQQPQAVEPVQTGQGTDQPVIAQDPKLGKPAITLQNQEHSFYLKGQSLIKRVQERLPLAEQANVLSELSRLINHLEFLSRGQKNAESIRASAIELQAEIQKQSIKLSQVVSTRATATLAGELKDWIESLDSKLGTHTKFEIYLAGPDLLPPPPVRNNPSQPSASADPILDVPSQGPARPAVRPSSEGVVSQLRPVITMRDLFDGASKIVSMLKSASVITGKEAAVVDLEALYTGLTKFPNLQQAELRLASPIHTFVARVVADLQTFQPQVERLKSTHGFAVQAMNASIWLTRLSHQDVYFVQSDVQMWTRHISHPRGLTTRNAALLTLQKNEAAQILAPEVREQLAQLSKELPADTAAALSPELQAKVGVNCQLIKAVAVDPVRVTMAQSVLLVLAVDVHPALGCVP